MDEKQPEAIGIERHYSPAQIAERLGLSTSTVARLLKDEPGVFKIGHEGLNRTRITLRVSESVWKRIQEKYAVKDDGKHRRTRLRTLENDR